MTTHLVDTEIERFEKFRSEFGSLVDHILDGRGGGHFITAVLTNNLRGAIGYADLSNQARLPEMVRFLYNHAPSECWGTDAKVAAWRDHGGLRGLKPKQVQLECTVAFSTGCTVRLARGEQADHISRKEMNARVLEEIRKELVNDFDGDAIAMIASWSIDVGISSESEVKA